MTTSDLTLFVWHFLAELVLPPPENPPAIVFTVILDFPVPPSSSEWSFGGFLGCFGTTTRPWAASSRNFL
ncbi:hypothetical protein A2U01_0047728, partial [Trifolium medium]|nr:hypothetical protein [Trifolium medium]